MKRSSRIFFCLLFLFSPLLWAQIEAVDQYGLPDDPEWPETSSPCYVGEMDPETRTPRWVGYLLDPAQFPDPNESDQKADRNKSSWKPYQSDEVDFSAVTTDYTNTKWDRGHLRPAATAALDQDLMDCTHTFGNAAPQSPRFNQGTWRLLEDDVRTLTRHLGTTGVAFTGTAYTELRSKRKYIGEGICIPDFYWKVVMFKIDGELHVAAWIISNIGHPSSTPAAWYRTSIDRIESYANINLFPKMPGDDEIEARVESGYWDKIWKEINAKTD